MLFYVLYYVAMKYYYAKKHKNKNETLTWTCWVYFILGLVLAITGHYFFRQMERDSRKSPAESRDLNKECSLWIFDYHDVWHFTSSLGLFFVLMAVLTIEDNNNNTKWNDIHVF